MKDMPTFDAPIPGQSLTTPPKLYPWENPPLIDKPEDALTFYINNMKRQEVMDDIFIALDEGFPLNILVKSLLSVGVMEGLHSIDVSLIIAPIIHEYIHGAAVAEGIKVKERPMKKSDKMKEKEKRVLASTLERSLEKSPKKDAGREILEEALEYVQGDMDMDDPIGMPQEEDMPMDDAPTEEEPKGLMARRGT